MRVSHRNVGFDTSDAEFDQSTKHLASGDLESRTATCNFDQKTVVVGLYRASVSALKSQDS